LLKTATAARAQAFSSATATTEKPRAANYVKVSRSPVCRPRHPEPLQPSRLAVFETVGDIST
jgi:hypothetical protein